MQVGVNRQTACMPGNPGVSIDSRHERGPFEIDLGCASTITIVHRLRSTLDDGYAVNRDLCVLLIVIIGLSIWFLGVLRRIVV
jgi:hypothetical protein